MVRALLRLLVSMEDKTHDQGPQLPPPVPSPRGSDFTSQGPSPIPQPTHTSKNRNPPAGEEDWKAAGLTEGVWGDGETLETLFVGGEGN